MESVKADGAPGEDQHHLGILLGRVFGRVREAVIVEAPGSLRPSHLRVLEAVPSAGISITDLARAVGMTKQGGGQFVRTLVASGHLAVVPDPDDRRVRLVRRTATGTRAVRTVATRLREVEAAWAAEVGPDRYRAFRQVLDELAAGSARGGA